MGCKILKRHLTLTTPLSGKIFHRQAETNVGPTKFEISRFTRYEAMNGGGKCRNGVIHGCYGHSRSWAMPPFDRAPTTSYSTLIETMCLSYAVFEI